MFGLLIALALFVREPQPSQAPDPAIAALAARLEKAATQTDRTAILDAEPRASLERLIQVCLDRGQESFNKYNSDLALRAFQSALAAAVMVHDDVRIAKAYERIGVVENRLGRSTEALEDYRHGLEAVSRTHEVKLRAELLRLMGVAQRALGNFTEALASDEESLPVFRAEGDTMGVIRVLNGIATSQARLGDFRKAAELFEECVKLGESMNSKVAVYNATESLGNVYAMQGDVALALVYLEKALALKQAAGANKGDLVNTYVNLIHAYSINGRESEGVAAAGQALALAREIGDEVSVAYSLLNRAGIYRKLKRYPDALADLDASLAIYEKEKTPLEIASTLSTKARVELDLGHDAAALEAARRGSELARAIPAPDVLWEALQSEGTAYARMQRLPEAHAAFAEGADTVDALRRQLAGGDENGLDFLADKMNLFHGLMALDIAAGKTEQALHVAERAKTGVIVDVLRAGHASITKAMTVAERDQEQQFERRVASLRTRSGSARQAVQKAESDLAAFRSALYAAHPELKVRRGESEPFPMSAAAEMLPDAHTALMEFAVAKDAAYLFTIARVESGKIELEVHKLAVKQDELAREVDDFRQKLASRDLGYRAAGVALYQQLFGPAAATLRGKTLLAIVPDGPLWSLPFQALVLPSGRHAIEDSAMFFVPSLTVLLEATRAHARGPSTTRPALLAMGDPELGKAENAFERLPEAAREVSAISQLYGKDSVTLTGAGATESRWKSLAPRYRVIHLATHGSLNSANPLYSNLLLGPGNGEDGLLEAREILDMDLHADLVVLSACETGRGGFRYGEGLVGLSWALMVAGTPTAVVSQWKVDSSSTTELMVAFHRELGKSESLAGKAAAFRTASLRLLKEGTYRHPFYWAGFVVVGDGY